MKLPGIRLLKEMLINDVGSRNVYENKRNMDKMTAKESGIFGNLKCILQKNSRFDGQFSLIDTFRAGRMGYLRRRLIPPPAAHRAQRIFLPQGQAWKPVHIWNCLAPTIAIVWGRKRASAFAWDPQIGAPEWRKLLGAMVGPWGLEPQTSTVSR